MKTILKTKQKRPLSIKLAIVFVFLLLIVSFFLSVKYSGVNKKEAELKLDTTILPPTSNFTSGFYSAAFPIALNPNGNCTILYTLDGSAPSSLSSIYSKQIIIQDERSETSDLSFIPTSPRWKPPIGNYSKGTVLRAICVKDGIRMSKELIQTFFIKKNHPFPVVALTINKDDFFGYKNGIYVMGKNYEDKSDYIKKGLRLNLSWWEYPSNYLKRGENSERPAHLEFYETDGKLAFQDEIGVRINGNATRGYSQKSLRICFDKKYGSDLLNYKVFPDNKLTKFKSLILRNSGNDWNKTMFRDAFMQSLVSSYLDIQSYRPSVLYINGEYWGIHNIRERSDEYYLSNKYNLSLDSITVLQFGGDVFYGKKSDKKDFWDFLNFIKSNDMSKSSNYEYVERQIDVNSFMDFIIANVYFCNSDWPNNNVKYWRYKSGTSGIDSLDVKDGRWRWMLYDTDWGFGCTGKESIQLNLLLKAKEVGSIGVIFSGLLKNKEFVEKFRTRFEYHLKNTFDPNAVIAKINGFEKVLAPEMTDHINRWREIGSFENWELNVQELRDFAISRPEIQRNQLNEFLKSNK